MRRSMLFVAAAVFAAACSNDPGREGTTAAPGAPAAAPGEKPVAKIPLLPGYKYYVGGPLMKPDAYGKSRLSEFLGEVAQPPSRGMVFGAKREGDKLEYRVWVNGLPVGLHRGVMRDGLYWDQYGEQYREGKLVARETLVFDDEKKQTKVTTEDLDPQTGEVIRTKEKNVSYKPPAIKLDESEDIEDDEDEAAKPDEAAPAAPPAPGAPTAPAAPAAPAPPAH